MPTSRASRPLFHGESLRPHREHCPESGWWYPTERQVAEGTSVATFTARFISEGSVMPTVGGRATLWLPGRGSIDYVR